MILSPRRHGLPPLFHGSGVMRSQRVHTPGMPAGRIGGQISPFGGGLGLRPLCRAGTGQRGRRETVRIEQAIRGRDRAVLEKCGDLQACLKGSSS